MRAPPPPPAKRVATAAGPSDTAFSLVAAPGRDGCSCVAVLFETPASAAAPDPSDFVDANGSLCADVPPTDARFGDMAAEDVQRLPGALGEPTSGPQHLGRTRHSCFGATADGEEHSMLRFEGRFYGWFVGQGDKTGRVTLIGYAANGTEVERIRL